MDCLSRKTSAWQSCDSAAEIDSPRTCELKLLRARRVAYYESIGILKTGSHENDSKSALKASPRAPLGSKTNPSESQTSTSRGHRQSPQSRAIEDTNMYQRLPKVADEKTKEDRTKVGQRVQQEGRRNSCPSELDLSLLDDVLVPETQKLRHVMNWAQRFLTKCHEGQELKSPPENSPFTLSLLDQSKTVQDCPQEAFMSSCHPPSWSQDDSKIHTNSQNSFNISSIPTENLSETCFSLDILSCFEERKFPGNWSSGGQEVIFQKEKRPPMSPLVGFRQPNFVQPPCDKLGNSYSQSQGDPGETGTPFEFDNVQPQTKDSCERSLFEKANENWHGNGYFWAPLTDSSEDECTDENGKNWKTFRKDIQLRDSKEISGISLSSRSPYTMGLRSPKLKGRWEANVSEKSNEGEVAIWKPRDFVSRFQTDSPWGTSGSVLISKLSTNQFDSPVDDFRMRKGESLSQELDFVVSPRDLNYRSGLQPEYVEDKTFVGQAIRKSQEVSINSGFDVGESKVQKRGQTEINETCQGNDSLIQISNCQLNSLGDPLENVTSKVCSDCVSECELTLGHHCVVCHNIRVDQQINNRSPTGIDWKLIQTPKVIAKEMTYESKEKNVFSNYPVSIELSETISENSLSWQVGDGGGYRISWDDALPEKSEQRASVLEMYFFYLHQLNRIRGCNSEGGSSSFSNHFKGLSENNVGKVDPEKKDIGEEIRSSGESGVFQAVGQRDVAKPQQENAHHVEVETTEGQLFPKSLSDPIKESKLHPEERPFSASIKITSKATGYKNYCEKSSVARSSHKRGERELRSQNISRPSSAKTENRRSTNSLCPSGSTPKYLCKNVHLDLERETSNKELNVTSCSGPRLKGDKLLLYASTFCNRLTIVDISWSGATDLGVLALAEGASSLQGLSINGCQITDKAIRALVKKHGKSLNKLEVFGCHALTARCVGCLALSCPHLQTLNIGRVPKITDACFAKILTNLKKVTTLNVTGLEMVRDRIVHLIVTQCPNLDCLVLSSCAWVTDISLLEISTYLRTIRYLDVSECKKITDIGIQALARGCHQLHYLDLSSTGISKRGVSLLASYCHGTLECVKLSFCKEITLDVIRKLCRNCRRLKMLHLYGCCITPNLSSVKDIYKTVEIFHDGSASTC
ncbi:uncharacterized protein [Notamacropus eugenii]|uniref:uncharacterized protein isoform X2 n=1 Tax=Notamacropus eugenii TaxID=9315 RepID=UPI003B67B6BB